MTPSWSSSPESNIIAADCRLQYSAGSRISPLTARSEKGHTSPVIPSTERDMQGDSCILQPKTHRPATTATHERHTQRQTTSTIAVHLHWKVRTNWALQREAAAWIMVWLGANSSSLSDHRRLHWQPCSAELDDLLKLVLKKKNQSVLRLVDNWKLINFDNLLSYY